MWNMQRAGERCTNPIITFWETEPLASLHCETCRMSSTLLRRLSYLFVYLCTSWTRYAIINIPTYDINIKSAGSIKYKCNVITGAASCSDRDNYLQFLTKIIKSIEQIWFSAITIKRNLLCQRSSSIIKVNDGRSECTCALEFIYL